MLLQAERFLAKVQLVTAAGTKRSSIAPELPIVTPSSQQTVKAIEVVSLRIGDIDELMVSMIIGLPGAAKVPNASV